MKKLINWYKNTSLSSRVIISMNMAIFISIFIISIFATINRQQVQKQEARALALNELNQLVTLLDFAPEKRLDEFREVVSTKTFYNTGFISMITSEGEVIFGRHGHNSNVSTAEFFHQIRTRQKGQSRYTDRLSREIQYQYFEYYPPRDIFLVVTLQKSEFIDKPVLNTLKILLFALIFTWITFSLVNYFIMRTITKPIKGLIGVVKQLSKGELPEKFNYPYKDEVGQMTKSVNELVEGLKQTSLFAKEIGRNNFDHSFTPLSENDALGNALLEMRHSIKTASEEEKIRKAEDEKRNWTTHGLALFGDILRQNNDSLSNLSYNIIRNLVNYLEVNQGGIFILNDSEENDKYLELTACHAYDRRKFLEKKVSIGEGLIGTCFLERETIYMTKIPKDYIKITSGLGADNPGTLLIIPLKINEKIYGVIELASFKAFEKHQIEFVEKIGESIASTISSVKINSQTTMLLLKSQQQAEEMSAQEEEMRQNMEELTATQEAMAEKDMENMKTIELLNADNKKMEEYAQSLEEEVETAFEECPENAVKSDHNGIIISLNKAARKLWAYSTSEIKGRSITTLVNKENEDFIGIYLVKNEPVSIKLKHKSGNQIPADVVVIANENQGQKYFTSYFRVVTQQSIPDQSIVPESDSTSNELSNSSVTPHNEIDYEELAEELEMEVMDEKTEDLLKSEPSDTQKAWSDHMNKKVKKFKKGKK